MVQAYGLGGLSNVQPSATFVVGAPTFQGVLGQSVYDKTVTPPQEYVYNGQTWVASGSGASGSFSSLIVNPGPTSLTGTTSVVGTTSINTSGSATTTIGGGLSTGVVNIGNTSGGTAITGPLSVTGNITLPTAGTGIVYNPPTAGGASPQTANGRVVQVTFTGVSIAATAEQSFVINNSSLGLSSIVEVTMRGATDGAALSIAGVSVSPTAITTTITNGTGATTSTANIVLTATILN